VIDAGKSLVLRYDPGQFTFNHFNHSATDEQLYEIAMILNEFQECRVDQVLKVVTQQF